MELTTYIKDYVNEKKCTHRNVIPSAETFIKEMHLQCDFKDATYEMLQDEEFFDNLRKPSNI